MVKLPITAMIVGYNEEHFLHQCFTSVLFCNEIFYTDLGSTDGSLQIAEKYTSQIYHRKIVPSCEMIQTEIVKYVENDWVLFIDPDEKVDTSLANQIIKDFDAITINNEIGGVMVPWQFYFKRKKLNGTIWGGINYKYLLVNKNRFEFNPIVHYGRKLKGGYTQFKIEPNALKTNVLHHYWMQSWKVFIKKHRRYLLNEGIDKYKLGIRTSLQEVLWSPYREFKRSYWTMKGYNDNLVGLFLSLFWSWYQSSALLSLLKIQKRKVKPS